MKFCCRIDLKQHIIIVYDRSLTLRALLSGFRLGRAEEGWPTTVRNPHGKYNRTEDIEERQVAD
jgi:hypothetical protein